jgi:hypothetical protein
MRGAVQLVGAGTSFIINSAFVARQYVTESIPRDLP